MKHLTDYRKKRLQDPSCNREKVFYEKWMEANVSHRMINHGVVPLQAALRDMDNLTPKLTKRDKEVAANLIAWLGTPCGRGFLLECEAAAKQTSVERTEK